jgi:hypothetical protein
LGCGPPLCVLSGRSRGSPRAAALGLSLPLAAFSVPESPIARQSQARQPSACRWDPLSTSGTVRHCQDKPMHHVRSVSRIEHVTHTASIQPASASREPPTSTFSATTAYRVKTPPANRAASQRCGKITPADFQRTETPQKLRLSARGESLHQTLAWAPYPQIPRELHAPTP